VVDYKGKLKEEPPKQPKVAAVKDENAKGKQVRAPAQKQELMDDEEAPHMPTETNSSDLLGDNDIWLFCPTREVARMSGRN